MAAYCFNKLYVIVLMKTSADVAMFFLNYVRLRLRVRGSLVVETLTQKQVVDSNPGKKKKYGQCVFWKFHILQQ